MMILRSYKSTALAAVVGVGVWAFVGCGDDGLPRRYPVYGTVTYKGKPVESGTITFTPRDLHNGRSAGGTIKDGNYSLASLTTDDGAMAGHYKVSVIAQKMITDGLDARQKLMYEKARSTRGCRYQHRSRRRSRSRTWSRRNTATRRPRACRPRWVKRATRSISSCGIETRRSRSRPDFSRTPTIVLDGGRYARTSRQRSQNTGRGTGHRSAHRFRESSFSDPR